MKKPIVYVKGDLFELLPVPNPRIYLFFGNADLVCFIQSGRKPPHFAEMFDL